MLNKIIHAIRQSFDIVFGHLVIGVISDGLLVGPVRLIIPVLNDTRAIHVFGSSEPGRLNGLLSKRQLFELVVLNIDRHLLIDDGLGLHCHVFPVLLEPLSDFPSLH